jgi:hypothetical protein
VKEKEREGDAGALSVGTPVAAAVAEPLPLADALPVSLALAVTAAGPASPAASPALGLLAHAAIL